MQKWEYIDIHRVRVWKERQKDIEYHKANDWIDYIFHPDGSEEKIEGNIIIFINQLGEKGWELVSISPRSSYLGGYHYTHHIAAPDFAGFTDTEIWVFKRLKP